MASHKIPVLVRAFSTSNISQQLVKPPIAIYGLDGRYATALYSAASKQKNLDTVEKDLSSLLATMKKNPKVKDFIKDPTIKRNVKAELLKSMAEKASFSPQSSNLLQCLAENGRLKILESVITSFKTIMSAHRGEVICEVTTAVEMDATQRQQLEAVLKTFLKGKESLSVTTKVDPSIVGGMIVGIGDRYVDMSISSKLKKYTELISAAV